MSDSVVVERATRIAAPASAIYALLVDFHRWRAWSPFEDLDPGMTRTYSGAESGVGSTYEWAGNFRSGAGRMEMTEVVADQRVVVEQRNHKPFRTQSTSTFTLVEADGATTVTWAMRSPVTPMSKVMGRVMPMEKVVGPVFEKGLARLRSEVE